MKLSILKWFIPSAAREAFRVQAYIYLDRMIRCDGNELTWNYKQSLSTLRPHARRVSRFMNGRNLAAFVEAWREYCEMGDAPLNMKYKEFPAGVSKAWLLPHYEAGRQKIEASLNKLINLAS